MLARAGQSTVLFVTGCAVVGCLLDFHFHSLSSLQICNTVTSSLQAQTHLLIHKDFVYAAHMHITHNTLCTAEHIDPVHACRIGWAFVKEHGYKGMGW